MTTQPEPDRYRKKPVEIEARQLDGTVESANRILGWIGSNGGDAKRAHATRPELGLVIHTLEGSMRAEPSDWIIRGVQGEFYPCKPDIFAATYEPAAVVSPPPATNQAEVRDRIRRVLAESDGFDFDSLEPHDYQIQAAALLAVLPTAVDRATVLREAAEVVMRLDYMELRADFEYDSQRDAWDGGTIDAAALLRRMADEAQQQPDTETPDAEAHPPTHTWKVESPRRDKWASWGATYDERVWAAASYEDVISVAPQRPFRLVRATTTYVVEAEHTPEPDGGPGGVADEEQPAGAARSVCVCGHTKGEHVTVSGRLLCDECNGLDGRACKEFEAL